MQERLGDVLGSAPGEPESDDEAFEQVRERVQALISAARTLSDTCADLADALRPLPGMVPDDPIVAGFGRLRAERTAALLDEAASAARGTLGLLQSAYGALDSQRARVGPEVPQTGTGTWAGAFVELPSRAFTVEDEAGTAVAERPWGRPAPTAPDATDPHGIPAAGGEAVPDEPAVGAPAETPAADEPDADTDAAATTPTVVVGSAPDDEDTAGVASDAAAETDTTADADAADTMATEPAPASGVGTDTATEVPVSATSEPADGDALDLGIGDAGAAREDASGELAEDDGLSTDPSLEVVAPGPPMEVTPLGLDEPDRSPDDLDEEGLRAWASPVWTRTDWMTAVEPTADETTAEDAEPDASTADDAAAGQDAGDYGAPIATTADETTAADAADAEGVGDYGGPDESTADESTGTADEVTGTADESAGTAHASTSDASAADDAAAAEAARDYDAADARTADDSGPADASMTAGGVLDAGPPEAADDSEAVQVGADDRTADDAEAVQVAEDGSNAEDGAVVGIVADGMTADGDRAEEAGTVGEHTRDDIEIQPRITERPTPPEDEHTPDDVDGDGLRGWATAAPTPDRAEVAAAALAGWIVVDPDDADDHGHPIPERAVAAAPSVDRLTVPVHDAASDPAADSESDPLAVPVRDPQLDPVGGEQADPLAVPVRDPQLDPVGGEQPDPFAIPVRDPGLDPLEGEQPDPFAIPLDDPEAELVDLVDEPEWDTVPDPDGPGWHGDPVSAEPRSLSLVPPVPDADGSDDPWATAGNWTDTDLSGAAAFARAEPPAWDPAFSMDDPGERRPDAARQPEKPLDEPAAAVLARQVEAARRHLQAALVVANRPDAPRQLGAMLTAIEQVLTAVTDLARETRGLLESGLGERTFPGEARFLCSPPWEGTNLVGRDVYGDDVATPAGLAKLLRALGYEARSVTSAGGMAGVQIHSPRYAMQVALVEPAGGGRQRWSGALEWVDESGATRTWAETLGPVELEDEELARRVDELLRRSVPG